MKHDQQAPSHPTTAEPRMKVRDADLRHLVHAHRAGPGTELWKALRELQSLRDQQPEGDPR